MAAVGSCQEQLGRLWEMNGCSVSSQRMRQNFKGSPRGASTVATASHPSIRLHVGQSEKEGGRSYETGVTV